MTQRIATIAAQATPVGRGGVGIIRISGPKAGQIAEAILGHCPKPRYAEYLPFRDRDNQILDQGLALYFPEPNSFTGDDVIELHAHGGPIVMDLLLQEVVAHGARLAKPGEFSERAFLNDKLDLAQAEAIADLIDAGSEEAARSAVRSLQGDFSKAIHALVEAVTKLRVYVEASMDFPEEEIDFISEGRVAEQISGLLEKVELVLSEAKQGTLLREGIHVVLIGQPNAGKSSLLNALARREAAIVTPIAGTTRDIVKEEIQLEGVPLHIFDTAGLRESEDVVEQEGIRRTWQAIEQADVILLLVDSQQGFQSYEQDILKRLPEALPKLVLMNKCDIQGNETGVMTNSNPAHLGLSATTGQGVDSLLSWIKETLGIHQAGQGQFIARRRHVDAIQRAKQSLEKSLAQANAKQAELIAEELRLAQESLGSITGMVHNDDLLGEIFSHFCIGK